MNGKWFVKVRKHQYWCNAQFRLEVIRGHLAVVVPLMPRTYLTCFTVVGLERLAEMTFRKLKRQPSAHQALDDFPEIC